MHPKSGKPFPWSVVAVADFAEKAVGHEASKVSGISRHLTKALLLEGQGSSGGNYSTSPRIRFLIFEMGMLGTFYRIVLEIQVHRM